MVSLLALDSLFYGPIGVISYDLFHPGYQRLGLTKISSELFEESAMQNSVYGRCMTQPRVKGIECKLVSVCTSNLHLYVVKPRPGTIATYKTMFESLNVINCSPLCLVPDH